MIEQAQFEIKAAKSDAIRTQADFERAVNLIDKGDISKRDYDDTLASNDIAQADLAQARSALLGAQACACDITGRQQRFSTCRNRRPGYR